METCYYNVGPLGHCQGPNHQANRWFLRMMATFNKINTFLGLKEVKLTEQNARCMCGMESVPPEAGWTSTEEQTTEQVAGRRGG